MNYDIYDASLKYLDSHDVLVAPNCDDAVALAKAYGGRCLIVRASDRQPIAAYGPKPALLFQAWRAAMMPNAVRGAA